MRILFFFKIVSLKSEVPQITSVCAIPSRRKLAVERLDWAGTRQAGNFIVGQKRPAISNFRVSICLASCTRRFEPFQSIYLPCLLHKKIRVLVVFSQQVSRACQELFILELGQKSLSACLRSFQAEVELKVTKP